MKGLVIDTGFPHSHNLMRKVSNVDTFDDLQDVTASNNNVGIGQGAFEGITDTTINAIALGQNVAASTNTGFKSISLGSAFGSPFDNTTSQNGIGPGSIAIGTSANGDANPSHLGNLSVMIGGGAAYEGCGDGVIAIGQAAGAANAPNDHAICIGTQAGNGSSSAAGANSICLGFQAGESGSGQDSVLIGHAASGTTDNSIVLNGTGTTLSSVADGLVIKPIIEGTVSGGTSSIKTPNNAGFTSLLGYNPSTGQIQHFPFT